VRNYAKTVRQPPTLELWEKHIKGERPLGVIPIRLDGKCKWGSIDVDQYDNDIPLELIGRVKRRKFPLVPCRSKSGGLHLYLFLDDWAPAALLQPALERIAASLGVANSEIFPKQTELAPGTDKLGNWILAPYFGSTYNGKLRSQVRRRMAASFRSKPSWKLPRTCASLRNSLKS